MLNKILQALCISCLSAASFAYQVQANLTINNTTNVPMHITVQQPNGQPEINQDLPAHQVTRVTKSQDPYGDPLENGMGSVLSAKQSHAFFTIKGIADNKIYLQGRVTYRAGAGVHDKWSFIDKISVASGLSFAPTYTCRKANLKYYPYNYPFNNQIVISGTPGDSMREFPPSYEDGLCQGFNYGTIGTYEGAPAYTPVCFDGTSWLTFQKLQWSFWGDYQYPYYYTYYDGHRWGQHGGQSFEFDYSLVGTPKLKAELDKSVGNPFCETWTSP